MSPLQQKFAPFKKKKKNWSRQANSVGVCLGQALWLLMKGRIKGGQKYLMNEIE